MGKVEIGIFSCVTADILTNVWLKCFWSNPLPSIWILSKSLILIDGHGNRNAKFSKKKNNKKKKQTKKNNKKTKQKHIQKSSSQKPYGGWSWNFAYMFMTLAPA